jgi:hypothetical protein
MLANGLVFRCRPKESAIRITLEVGFRRNLTHYNKFSTYSIISIANTMADPAKIELDNVIRRIRDLHAQCLAAYNAKLPSPAPPPPPYQWHPDDPLMTERQRELAWYYEMFGIAGLAHWIVRIARAELLEDKDSSWRKLTEDYEVGNRARIYYYLAGLPPDAIPALIAGDLPSRMLDLDFKAKVGPHIDTVNSQGTYIVYAAHKETGKNVSLNQLR